MEDLSTTPDIPIDLVGAAASTVVIKSKVSGDAQYRLNIKADGTLEWGSGSGAVDITLARSSAGALEQKSVGTSQAYHIYGVYVDASNYERLAITTTPGLRSTIFQEQAGTGVVCDFRFGVTGAANVTIVTSNSSRWDVNSSGHLMGATDNTYDIGASGVTRPRSIYWGTQAFAPNGLVGTPAYSFAAATNAGIYRNADASVHLVHGGNSLLCWYTTSVAMASNVQLGWTSSSFGPNGTQDVVLARDAAATLALKNVANAQNFRIYGTTTGPQYLRLAHDGSDGIVDTVGGGTIGFKIAGTTQWFISASILGCATDNAEDLGASGATRPRSIFVGTNMTLGGRIFNGDGSSASPSYSFGAGTDLGFLRGSSTTVWFAGGSAARLSFGTTGLKLAAAGLFGWSSDANPDSTSDVLLQRDAAAILAQRNGTTGQAFRVYNTFTDASNYERGMLEWSGNVLLIGAAKAGTGTTRFVNFQGGDGTAKLQFHTDGNVRCSDDFHFSSDNTHDIGASGATRPRSIYWGTQLLGPNGSAAVPSIAFAGFTNEGWWHHASANVVYLAIGGATVAAMAAGVHRLASTVSLTWSSGDPSIAGDDLLIVRDAANRLAQRNGTTAQITHVYNTFTSSTNYERFDIDWATTANTCNLWTAKGSGGGTARNLALGTDATARWVIAGTTGHQVANVDNTYDIGSSGANRPRTLYLGTSLNVVAAAVTLDTNGITMGDAKNIIVNATTGTKIGTATTQKLGFWNATPIVQPAGIANADGTLADITTKFNTLLNSVIEAVGLTATV